MSIDRSLSTTSLPHASATGVTRVWIVATLAVLTISTLAVISRWWPRATPSPAIATLRLALSLPDELTLGAGPDYLFGLALAPDGRRLVFPASRSGVVQLWMRDLAIGSTQPLPGTDDGTMPFWSPDGRSVGFFATGRLRVITLDTARVEDIGEAPSPRGGAWDTSGDIIFAPHNDGPLFRRRASDGTIEPLTALDKAGGESSHRHPAFTGDGQHLVFFVRSTEPAREGLWLAAVDHPSERKRLIATDAHALVLNDLVLYSSDGALVAQRLDVESRSLARPAILIGAPVGRGVQNQLFAAGAGDVLIFGAPASGLRELRWVDRAGSSVSVAGEPMHAWDVRISPSGSAIAVTRVDPQLNTLDIWTYEGERPLPRRISPAIAPDEAPAWAEDGARLAWVSGRRAVNVRSALAKRPEESIHKFENPVRVTDWSPDFQFLVVTQSRPNTRDDIWILPADGRGSPRPYTQSPFNESQGALSPNGRWMAYASDESGHFEIYIDSFPTPGTRARVTSGGGVDPRWRRDGGEVYFRRGAEIHAASLNLSGGLPEAIASSRLFDLRKEIRAYDATADGQRFLVNLPAETDPAPPIAVFVNWQALVREAYPERK